jgi:hypothetical protein
MKSIHEVVERLSEIIDWARGSEQPAGYFAALYRVVTLQVAAGIERGFFEDGLRMERLDVVFATRYLDAFDGWRAGRTITRSWAVALARTESWRPIVLQHLLGGINAHINLDLGIAAATVSPGSAIGGLERDFQRINEILARLVQGTKDGLVTIWPPLRLIDRIAGTAEDAIVDFSMRVARDGAWELALRLASLSPEAWPDVIAARDEVVGGRVADLVYRPGWLASTVLLAVRLGERGSVASKIALLTRIAEDTSGPGPIAPARQSASRVEGDDPSTPPGCA